MKRALVASLIVIGLTATGSPADGVGNGWVADYRDDFDGSVLDEGWTLRDGFAEQFPEATEDHASFELAEGQFTISIPGGEEHNMWDLRHAEAMRSYEGSGVYQIKVDSDFTGDQQFGLSFESSPGTFLLFMLYAHDEIHGYIERFVQMDGYIEKKTVVKYDSGFYEPDPGPYFMRVAVDDDTDNTQRSWTFDWSRDGANWMTVGAGVFEEGTEDTQIGDIATVSLFAGNQPYTFSAFDARFDYFYASSSYEPAPLDPPTVAAASVSARVDLTWNEVLPDDDYRIYRAMSSGSLELIGQSSEPSFTDLDVQNGTGYEYVVTVLRNGSESVGSAPVSATPHLTGLEALPGDGLVMALLGSELDIDLNDGEPVTAWRSVARIDGSPSPVALGTGDRSPTFVSSGIGGVPSVRFDGVDDFLRLGSGFEDFSDGVSMFVVASPSAVRSGSKLLLLGNGAGQQNISLGRSGSSPGLQYFTNDDEGTFSWFNTADGLSNESGVYSMVQGGGAPNSVVSGSVFRDGVTVGSGSVFVPPVVSRGANFIGKSYWADQLFEGDIAEVLLYDRALTSAEQATVNGYLSTKYGIVPPAPVAPSGVSVSAGDGEVSLAWTGSQNATAYRVYRSESTEGPFVQVAEVSSLGHVDTSVTNGVEYHYRVTANGAGGESPVSATVSATPMTVPGPPVGVPLDGLVLSLDASALSLSDGASVSTWLDGSGVGVNASSSGSERPTFVSSGIGGVPSVRFDGVDDFLRLGSGFEDFSDGVSMFVVASPSAVRSGSKLLLLGNGAGQQNISLGRSGSSPGLQYFTTDASGGFGWFNTADGLSNESGVYSMVQGGGAPNSVVSGSVFRDGVTVGSGSVFVPPVVSRGANFIGKSYWADQLFEGDIAEVLLYDRALTSAEQATVNGYLSTKYGIVPPAPVAPSGVSVSAGDGEVSLAWTGSQDATAYRVYRSESTEGPFVQVAEVSSLGHVDTSVTNGVEYHYRVTANGAGGESPVSATVSATPMTVPGPPVGVPLDGLVLSLDASALSLSDGASVSTWLDGSGVGVNASSSGSERPTFVSSGIGGVPSVRFDGVDDFLRLGSGFEDFSDGVSMFVVASPSAVRSGSKLLLLGNGAGQQNISLGRSGSSPGLQYFTTDASGGFGWFNTADGLSNESGVYSMVQGGGAPNSVVSGSVFRDGVTVGSGSVFVPPVVSRGANFIGKSYWADQLFEGDIAEVLLYDRALTSAEQATVNGYLSTKYGIVPLG